jgi:uncharacterized protein (DUF433 family)
MQIEIPDELAASLAKVAEQTGQDVNTLATEMLTEAVKMRRVPGILFADGPTGRRARIGGTGIEVFEVIDRYELVGRDRLRLQELFDWLEPHQLSAAIAFYEAFPDEIRARLHTDEEDRAAIEALWREIPQTSPDWPGRRQAIPRPTSQQARESA